MAIKNDGVLTSMARVVGTTAGVIVAKSTQLKDEVMKMGSAAVKSTAKKPAAKKAVAKKPVAKKAAAKKRVVRAGAKRNAAPKKTTKRART